MPIRANIVTGFLGAGKTTTLLHLLGKLGPATRTAVLVNEFGKVGIDGEILAQRGEAIDVVELPQGCICCTLRGDLLRALAEIAQTVRPDRLLLEPTGIAQPGDLVETFAEPSLAERYRLGALITVVDPATFWKVTGRGLPFYERQIDLADVLVLNKADLVGDEEMDRTETALRSRNAAARIVRTAHGRIDPALLDLDARASISPAAETAPSGHNYKGRICAFGFELGTEAHQLTVLREAFESLRTQPPPGARLLRAKGFFATDEGGRRVEIAGDAVHVSAAESETPRVDFVVELAPGVELGAVEAAIREAVANCRVTPVAQR